MTEQHQFESAYSHLAAALPLLHKLGRMERSERASGFDLAALVDAGGPNTR